MAKSRASYICESCGTNHGQWAGRCETCGEWNSIVESRDPAQGRARSGGGTAVEISQLGSDPDDRRSTGISEFDRVLGGGLVPGSLVLLGGDPGIGKSTLVLEVAAKMSTSARPCLYFAAEESAAQIQMRARRLGLDGEALFVYPDTDISGALAEAARLHSGLIVVDSIQTVRVDTVGSAPGTVSQVREATLRLLDFAKASGTSVLIVGHVTKEGTVAGPRTLEHMVDTVLYLEGDDYYSHRLLRSVKNRFGPTFEVAVFDMRSNGLQSVSNPSVLFLAERDASAPGSAVAVPMEGSRPLLVEVQALVSPTAYSLPRRLANGFDLNRLNMLLAVLGRRADISLASQDVYVNVVGGMRLREPAVDLAVALAVASSHRSVAPDHRVAAIGEIGLAGEVRSVPSTTQRVREACRLGFDQCLIPAGRLTDSGMDGAVPTKSLRHALEATLG